MWGCKQLQHKQRDEDTAREPALHQSTPADSCLHAEGSVLFTGMCELHWRVWGCTPLHRETSGLQPWRLPLSCLQYLSSCSPDRSHGSSINYLFEKSMLLVFTRLSFSGLHVNEACCELTIPRNTPWCSECQSPCTTFGLCALPAAAPTLPWAACTLEGAPHPWCREPLPALTFKFGTVTLATSGSKVSVLGPQSYAGSHQGA